ncbi:MAG TPA: AbrB/MazE/SpoVT family DNA-binding domain-containing protein [Chloroflexota bacterium]|nr:AbrB/MazE/SpoVT family DNA-binding domain-containing protein [Chloroflexota bacterium]
MESTVLSSRGQVVLPKAIRDRLGLAPGQRLAVEVSGQNIVLTPAARARRTAHEAQRTGWRSLRGALRGTNALDALRSDRQAELAAGR